MQWSVRFFSNQSAESCSGLRLLVDQLKGEYDAMASRNYGNCSLSAV